MAFKKSGGFGERRSSGAGFGRSDRAPRAGGRSFDRKPYGSRGGSDRAPLELFNVTCAQCGKETQVPFKPTGARPVLCRDCFKGGDAPPRRYESSAASSAPANEELRLINEKLDKIMESLGIE